MNNLKLPHEKLFEICRDLVGNAVWALEMASDEKGNIFWCVYYDKKKADKKLPTNFMNKPVKAIFCKRPKIK